MHQGYAAVQNRLAVDIPDIFEHRLKACAASIFDLICGRVCEGGENMDNLLLETASVHGFELRPGPKFCACVPAILRVCSLSFKTHSSHLWFCASWT